MAQNNEKFNSIEELYKRLIPAINTKLDELKKNHMSNINNLDIWNYCMYTIWANKKDIRLYEMVSDILDADILEINKFKKNNYDRNEIDEKDNN